MLQYLLLPFALLYGIILRIRHLLYDLSILKSCSFKEAVIVIGNLSVGGTGKSPHTMYVAKLLEHYNLAILSRGYGRKSKGFRFVNQNSLAKEVGDEPLMFKSYLKNSTVAVCENRCEGIRQLLSQDEKLEAVILDDAFQHRALKPGLSILLIDYKSLKGNFCLLPAGRRRDIYSRWKAADIIIIT
jgi:tetraacyldisaccharide 4'-kinase